MLNLVVLLFLLLGVSVEAQAVTFWDESFETHLWTGSNGNPWSMGSCGRTDLPDGCNPRVSTARAHTGTHSLEEDFTGTLYGDATGGSYGNWIDRNYPPSSDIYTRMWVWLESNFAFQPGVGSKWFYHRNDAISFLTVFHTFDNAASDLSFQFYGMQNPSPAAYGPGSLGYCAPRGTNEWGDRKSVV